MLPRALERLTALIDSEGGDREPELLEAAFNCLALLCKHLARYLLPDLPAVLHMSAGLRYACAPHVRAFAAQAVAFLLRLAASAPDAGVMPAAGPAVALPSATAGTGTPGGASGGGAARAAGASSGGGDGGGGKGGGALHGALRALLAEHALHPSEEVRGVHMACG
jgi:uncharacterized membrane protein YgcG